MIVQPLVHGISLAFALILPLGAQNTFIINQGASHTRYIRVMPAVITAGLCDTLLIVLATTGVSSVVLLNSVIKYVMLVVSILFLSYLGFKMWRAPVANTMDAKATTYSFKFQVLTAMTLSLLNPHAIADTVAAIGTTAMTYSDATQRLYFVTACIAVSWIWFVALSVFGKTLSKNTIYNLYQNKISALMIWSSCFIVAYSFLTVV